MSYYAKISSLLTAIENCRKNGNHEWEVKHEETINTIIKEHFPSGGGFDAGTSLLPESNPEKLVFQADFHHMNDAGYYDGWTEHKVTVTASLSGLHIKVSGRNKRDIKDYIGEVFAEIGAGHEN